MIVKSHPFCLKILLFVWVTCRWSRLVAVDCCREWLPLTVSLGALIRNGMGNFSYCFLFLAYYFYEFSWICCWNNLWDFALRPSGQSCLRWCWIKFHCKVLNDYVDRFLKNKLLFIPFKMFKKCSIPFKLWILWLIVKKFLCW